MRGDLVFPKQYVLAPDYEISKFRFGMKEKLIFGLRINQVLDAQRLWRYQQPRLQIIF